MAVFEGLVIRIWHVAVGQSIWALEGGAGEIIVARVAGRGESSPHLTEC